MESFFQTKAWGEFKKKAHWQPHDLSGSLGLTRHLPFGRKILYLPELPFTEDVLEKVAVAVRSGVLRDTMFTRFEFLTPWTPESASLLISTGLIKSFEEVQPEYRVWVSLEDSEEKILAQMKPKGRYNIKIAERHQLKVEYSTEPKAVEQFFKLYQHTAKRTDFSGRGLTYFQELVELLKREDAGEIILIKHKEEVLSAGIFLCYKDVCSYLYGGSGGDRSLMAPYLMHWKAMKRGKDKGCKMYDLLAIAPLDAPDDHPYAGLTRFKTQFGGEQVRLLGSWDFVGQPFWYTIYRLIEKRRRKSST
jgi:lipid II:glycine glycyltransferase (peptidoglycan interpeptide bridge formation enzyme)